MASDDVILESGRLPQVVAGLHWQRASESLDHEMAKKKYKVAIFLSFFLPIYLLDLQLQLLLNYRSMTSIALNSRSLTLGVGVRGQNHMSDRSRQSVARCWGVC